MIIFKVRYCPSVELKYGTPKSINSSLFTQFLKRSLSTSSDFTTI